VRDIKVGAAQFEARDADKNYNLGRIAELTSLAARQGAEIVSFARVATVRGLLPVRGVRGPGATVGRSAQRAMQRAWSCVGDVGETGANDERH